MSRLAESSAGGEKKEGEGKHEVVKKKDEYRTQRSNMITWEGNVLR